MNPSQRKIWRFHGGVQPPENKSRSLQRGITCAGLPERLVLPLNQHIGSPAEAVVKPGDHVLKGEKIAEATGPVSAPVHASTSGSIVAIEDHPIAHPSGLAAPCIILLPDGQQQWIARRPCENYRQQTPEALLSLIREAGIVGLGGAGFPSAVKLHPTQKISTLIINAAECEPYITADDALIRERAAEILRGIDILAYILGEPAEILIGIEDNKAEAIATLMTAIAECSVETSVEVVVIPTKYPSGGEKQLIQILTGQEVPSGKLPVELGIICQNVGSAHAVYRAICKGEPLLSRITTVSGKACTAPGNFEALIGTPVEHLLVQAGFQEARCQRLIMGGPMMGFTLNDASVPVIKTTNCLLAADNTESPSELIAQACIRCGHCAEVCPVKLLPQQLYWYARARDYDQLAAHHLPDCIECGACAYVCPSDIPLVQYYRAAKGEIRLMNEEAIAADRARQRFEYHQQRVERAEQEKAARREARKKAAAEARAHVDTRPASEQSTTETRSDVVQAALARVSADKTTPEQSLARLERAVSAAQSRLKKAEDKLTRYEAGDSKRGALEAAVAQHRIDYENANKKLAEQQANAGQAKPSREPPEDQHGAGDMAVDRATLAIQKARQKAEQMARMSEVEKLQSQRQGLVKRLDKARARLVDARTSGDENLDAFANAISKLEAKLQQLDADLAAAELEHARERN